MNPEAIRWITTLIVSNLCTMLFMVHWWRRSVTKSRNIIEAGIQAERNLITLTWVAAIVWVLSLVARLLFL